MRFSPQSFAVLGLEMAGHQVSVLSQKTNERRFASSYGCSWHVCAETWNLLWDTEHPIMSRKRVERKHFLWALALMKSGESEHSIAGKLGLKSEKTLRKWAWLFIVAIADLDNTKVSPRVSNCHFDDNFFTPLLSPCAFVFLLFQQLDSSFKQVHWRPEARLSHFS